MSSDRNRPISANQALERLKEGNKRYTEGNAIHPDQGEKARHDTTGGQWPIATFLSCADSRVAPEIMFDQGIGDLFVNRVAGNVSTAATIASIEYSVAHLNVPLLVVMGHEECGAVKAALGNADNGYNLNILLSHILPAVKEAGNEGTEATVKANARLNARDMIRQSTIIGEAYKEGKIHVYSAYYHLDTGAVDFYPFSWD